MGLIAEESLLFAASRLPGEEEIQLDAGQRYGLSCMCM